MVLNDNEIILTVIIGMLFPALYETVFNCINLCQLNRTIQQYFQCENSNSRLVNTRKVFFLGTLRRSNDDEYILFTSGKITPINDLSLSHSTGVESDREMVIITHI